MKAEELAKSNSIIIYADGVHSSSVFINGFYEGYFGAELYLSEALLTTGIKLGAKFGVRPLLKKKIFLPDLTNLTPVEIARVHDFFTTATMITLKQQLAIFDENYQTLLELI
jgi:hypothetical protein